VAGRRGRPAEGRPRLVRHVRRGGPRRSPGPWSSGAAMRRRRPPCQLLRPLGAAHSRKKGACLPRPGHSTTRARRPGHRQSALWLDYESRFATRVRRTSPDAYLRGETPIPCVRCHQNGQVPRPFGHRARPGRAAPRWRPATMCGGLAGARGPSCTRAGRCGHATSPISCSPPPRDPARLPALSARRPAQAGRAPGRRRNWAWAVADKPDSQDICFVARKAATPP